MPQLSKYPLNSGLEKSIVTAFEDVVAGIKTKHESMKFIEGLLTETERVMLSKRLAIILLIQAGQDYKSIKDKLNVSTSTISILNRLLDSPDKIEFVKIIESLIKPQSNKSHPLLEYLTNILSAPLLPKSGSRIKYRKEMGNRNLS